MHKDLSNQAVEILKKLPEVSKIILYGSVLRGDYKKDSDIDLAIICNDLYKLFPLDMEGIPLDLRQKINNSLEPLTKNSEIKFHIPIYWNYELQTGIELYSTRDSKRNQLKDIGLVVYDAYNNYNK
jgi:predicted nucleotidyltransferase